MASFKIHEDQENPTLSGLPGKQNNENLKNPRKVLGSVNQIAHCRPALSNKSHINGLNLRKNENQQCRAIAKTDKRLQPPVAQFEAFSVYEDQPEDKAENPKENVKPVAKREEKSLPSTVLNLNTHRIPLQEKKLIIENVDSPMSISLNVTSSPVSVSKCKVSEDEEAKAKAITVRDLFFHVAEYREDIYNYMREIELKHRPKAGYMSKQRDISGSMRAILVDWLVEVSEEYRLHTETLYLSVSYIDRFLSYMSVVRAKLQLVGTAAMFIASKYEEIFPPDIGEFVYITDDTYSKQQVLRMEHLILKVLSFDLSTPTPLAFISHFCIANGLTQKTLFLAMYVAELSLLEAEPFLEFPASVLGASSIVVARHTLLCCHCSPQRPPPPVLGGCGAAPPACALTAWPEALRTSSRYRLADLEPCCRLLERVHAGAADQPHRAIPDKYKSTKYEEVANIKPKAMYPAEEQKFNNENIIQAPADNSQESQETS